MKKKEMDKCSLASIIALESLDRALEIDATMSKDAIHKKINVANGDVQHFRNICLFRAKLDTKDVDQAVRLLFSATDKLYGKKGMPEHTIEDIKHPIKKAREIFVDELRKYRGT